MGESGFVLFLGEPKFVIYSFFVFGFVFVCLFEFILFL